MLCSIVMAVMKLSSSGKQVQFIDEEGNMFVTSAAFTMGLLQRRSPLVLLSRLPLKVSKGRFKVSPLYDPSGLAKNNEKHSLTTSNDGLSPKVIESNSQKSNMEDKSVW